MLQTMTVTLRTLTPLWTGGPDQACKRVRASGIVGSLRWWYEALIRGLGGHACDPTRHTCAYDASRPDQPVCPACKLFGATGWARRFRLAIEERMRPDGPQGAYGPDGKRADRRAEGRRTEPTWYFPRTGLSGTLHLSVVPLAPDLDPNLLLGVLALIERHGALGARTQFGYGRVQLEGAPELDVPGFVASLQHAAQAMPARTRGLPALDEMFFARIETREQPLAAVLKLRRDLRASFRSGFGGNRELRHFICGTVAGGRQASKVWCSQAVNGVMSVWGWVPDEVPHAARGAVVEHIAATLEASGNVRSWREYNSPRDTVLPSSPDREAFVASLLEKEAAR
ncbi:MAG: type III-B CRISPR module RAMP protein Cmr1 [Anaerolineae bacterium]|nr:type III-B CRISPR module RAMP protein Cmr1 [Anaerolineae bacterium]